MIVWCYIIQLSKHLLGIQSLCLKPILHLCFVQLDWDRVTTMTIICGIIHDNKTVRSYIKEKFVTKPLLKMISSHLIMVITSIFWDLNMRVVLGIQPISPLAPRKISCAPFPGGLLILPRFHQSHHPSLSKHSHYHCEQNNWFLKIVTDIRNNLLCLWPQSLSALHLPMTCMWTNDD